MFGFMVLFVALLLTAFLSFNLAAYFLMVKIFAIQNATQQTALLTMLLLLSASFVAGMLISHRQNNAVARAFYFISAIWVGLLFYLTFFLALTWVAIGAFSFLGVYVNEILIGVLAIACAIAYTTYGILNAFNVQVVKIAVKLKNLPSNWKGKKIVQISDVHLGFVFRQGFLTGIVNKINELEPDMVMITGDLFDGSSVDLDVINGYLDDFKAPKGTYFVTGNHETYLGPEKVFRALSGTNIRILRDEMVEIDGLQIIGIEYPLPGETKDVIGVIKHLKDFDREKPSVLLLHEPVQIGQIKKTGISLQLSGHTHFGQLFPLGLVTRIMYRGYDFGLRQEGDFSIYTSSGVGGWGPPLKTGSKSEIVEITLQ